MPKIELELDTQEHVATVQRIFTGRNEKFNLAPGTNWLLEKNGTFVLDPYKPSHIFPPPENLLVKFRYLTNSYSDPRLIMYVVQTTQEMKEDPDTTGEMHRNLLEACCLNLATGEIDGHPTNQQFVLTADGIHEILESFVDFAHNPLQN